MQITKINVWNFCPGFRDGPYVMSHMTQITRKRMTIAGTQRAVIRLKLGVGTTSDDIAQVNATLDVMGEDQILLADANGGWSVEEACEIISKFDDQRIVWEEPCRVYDDNAEVARRSGQPVMVDQCVGQIELAKRAIDERVVSSLCIKPAFLGGLSVARQVRDACTEAGMKMRIDGPWCGDIASAAILHLAAGAPPALLIAGCDLREPLVLAPNLEGVVSSAPARIAPPPGPGLGIVLPQGALGAPEAIYQ